WKAWNVLGSHTGTIPVSGGQLFINEGLITGGQIVMDMKNLQVSDLEGQDKADLEAHLRGTTPGKENDFFNTSQYPTATYTILRSEKLNGDPEATDIIYGSLQIRDVTKPVNIKVKMDAGASNAIKITTLPFIIDRTEWGIKFWSKKLTDTLKENIINDEVQIEFTIGAIAG
ncbi:MAG TPA: YceI family protein, partial [Saprospiraceae bacterium]|nr:YceI family protein [Saprospiraceae bacterium]